VTRLLGLDLGTTGAKAVVIDETGKVVSRATEEYPLIVPRPGWSEQDAGDWWKASTRAIRTAMTSVEADPGDIEGVGLTGQMHGLVLLDSEGKVLRNPILWNDQRTTEQCAWITEKLGGEQEAIRLTCNPVLAGFTAPKLIWVRQNEPSIYSHARKILLPKDFIRFKLTGGYATEVSDASGTSLFDVRKRRWSDEVAGELDIPSAMLPDVHESTIVTGEVSRGASDETGLRVGTPVVGGGGDQAAGAVGNGIVRPGVISATIGTSGVVFAHTDEVKVDPEGRLHTFCHAVPGKWHVMGVMLSAGGSMRWFRDKLSSQEVQAARERSIDPYELLTSEASKIPPGSEGLLFLPYLSGERTPHKDPDARGVFFGLSLRTGKGHLVRAIMEGVAFGMRDSLEIMKSMGVPIVQVRVSGGGARSGLWRQIQSDIYGVELHMMEAEEGPAFGSALIAGVGVGTYGSVEEACDKAVRTSGLVEPVPEKVKLYDRRYRMYSKLYQSLRPTFKELARLA
jgi:xylulokinase